MESMKIWNNENGRARSENVEIIGKWHSCNPDWYTKKWEKASSTSSSFSIDVRWPKTKWSVLLNIAYILCNLIGRNVSSKFPFSRVQCTNYLLLFIILSQIEYFFSRLYSCERDVRSMSIWIYFPERFPIYCVAFESCSFCRNIWCAEAL